MNHFLQFDNDTSCYGFFLYLSQCSLSFLDLLVYKFQQIRKMFGYFFKTVFFILQLLFLISWLHCLLGCLILFFISLMLNWLFSLVFQSFILPFCNSFAFLLQFFLSSLIFSSAMSCLTLIPSHFFFKSYYSFSHIVYFHF